MYVKVKPGLPPWGPHVRFRRVQTLVREAVRWSRSAILHSAKRSPAISRGGAENQIIVDYEVYARRPNDSDLLIPSIAAHQAKLGRVPRLLATDAGFYSARNEAAAKAMGERCRRSLMRLRARATTKPVVCSAIAARPECPVQPCPLERGWGRGSVIH